jgi:hypothetical protein
MRVFAQCAAAGCLAAMVAVAVPSGTVTAQSKDATVFAAARQALGGEKKLSAVKTFTATGRTRQVRGDNLVPIEFEISVELPDKYLRKDEIPAQESGPTASGFNGDELLLDPPPATPPAAAPGRPGGPGPGQGPGPNPAEVMRKARVTTLKQDFARLTLGMFATSFPSYPLTFTYVGEAEAPQGTADVIDAKGANNFTIRLFISKDTHLPIMVSWQAPAGRGGPGPAGRGPMPGGPPGGPGQAAAPPVGERGAPPAGERGAPPAGERGALPAGERGAPPAGERPSTGSGQAPSTASGQAARPAPPPPVENRLYFADYRDVDGMQFPFRLRRAVGADTIEETTFDRYKVNPKIDPRKFEIKK